ncbi:MAG: histidine kinase dimerization/phospho-acceptor domain-containing protein [Oscillospiraceae bacterium]|nr:histidine kinase dimerization/phospho-acceptor domain-containing protein [Oscillospiraceae bacterium]
MSTDTNTLISISSADKNVRRLVSEINLQLRTLRDERRRLQNGDAELKTAVTNISHDLRTPLTAISGYLDLLEKETLPQSANRYCSN